MLEIHYTLDAAAPPGTSIHPFTGIFSWTPSESQGAGVYPITLTVTDNGSPPRSTNETFLVTVNEVNASPALAVVGNQSVVEGNLLTFTATATDIPIQKASRAS